MSNKQAIITELEASVDPILAHALIEQAEELEREFALKHWKYSQLDGGRLCEIASRIIFAADSGTVNLTKSVESCIRYIEDDGSVHNYPDRQALQHINKVIKAAYKLRSQRGAVHFTPKYSADESDSRFILECCRWIIADILRLFTNTSKTEVQVLFQDLSRYPVALVSNYEDRQLLQHVGFTTAEEVLAILYFGPSGGMSMKLIISLIPKDQSGVRRAIAQLLAANKRQIIEIGGTYRLTSLGIREVEKVINLKAFQD